jgi:inner membrane protein
VAQPARYRGPNVDIDSREPGERVQEHAANVAEQAFEAPTKGEEQVVAGNTINKVLDLLDRLGGSGRGAEEDDELRVGVPVVRSGGAGPEPGPAARRVLAAAARRSRQPLMRRDLLGPRPWLDSDVMRISPAALFVVVVLLDLTAQYVGGSTLVVGLLDEPAHLATAALVLLALPPLSLRTTLLVLVGSVALDLDHIPLYLHVPYVAAAGGRPVTHSALTVAVLLLAARLVPASRPYLLPLAGGVLLHFMRDGATGQGIPLLWPYDRAVLIPYEIYVAVLAALALIGTGKRLHVWRLRGRRPW